MATLQAIETRYAGCRFRSRLEARWAVFFDHMGIAWEYEPQGLMCRHRLTLAEGTFTYLPDFWLPGLHLWAEVKGSLTDDEMFRLLDAAAFLSANGGGGCHDSGGHDVVVLGPVPQPGTYRAPARLHMHKGTLTVTPWRPRIIDLRATPSPCSGVPLAGDYGGREEILLAPKHIVRSILLEGDTAYATEHNAAYTAARSARFEHGERG